MQLNNPDASGNLRPAERLCAGQTLLCRALGLKVPDWDAKRFDPERLYVEDCGAVVAQVIQTTRLGIPMAATNISPTASSMPNTRALYTEPAAPGPSRRA